MNKLLKNILTILVCITNSPTIANLNFHITREQANCLFKQVDMYLKEPVDPVIIILTSTCPDEPKKEIALPESEKFPMPEINIDVDENDDEAIESKDILILNKKYLSCYKTNYIESDGTPPEACK